MKNIVPVTKHWALLFVLLLVVLLSSCLDWEEERYVAQETGPVIIYINRGVNNEIVVNWNSVENATGFLVQYADNSEFEGAESVEVEDYVIHYRFYGELSGFEENGKVFVKVKTLEKNINNPFSNILEFPLPTKAVSDLEQIKNSEGIVIRWQGNSDSYNIYISDYESGYIENSDVFEYKRGLTETSFTYDLDRYNNSPLVNFAIVPVSNGEEGIFSKIQINQSSVLAIAPEFFTENHESYTKIQMFNVSFGKKVATLLLKGKICNVEMSYDGMWAYVSTSYNNPAGGVDSFVNIFRTDTAYLRHRLSIPGELSNGEIALSQDGLSLYITHSNGVTKIHEPNQVGKNLITSESGETSVVDIVLEQTEIPSIYSGQSLTLSNNDRYLFVSGTDSDGIDGISVIDVATQTELTSFQLGENRQPTSLIFEDDNHQLYVANTLSDQLVTLSVSINDEPESIELSVISERQMESGSRPVDMALKDNNLLVALSFRDENTLESFGEGRIDVISTQDDSLKTTIPLSREGNDGSLAVEVHPISLAIKKETLHVLKRLDGDSPGLYIESITNWSEEIENNSKILSNTQLLDAKIDTSLNGNFVGPECLKCSNGF